MPSVSPATSSETTPSASSWATTSSAGSRWRARATAFETGAWGAGTLLYRVPDPERFGVAELDADGRVIGFEEKPAHPKSDLIPIGVYFLRADAFEVIGRLAPSGRGEFEITDVLNHYIPGGGLFTRGLRRPLGGRGHRVQSCCAPRSSRPPTSEAGTSAPPMQRPLRPRVTGRVGPADHVLVTGGAGLHRLRASSARSSPVATAPGSPSWTSSRTRATGPTSRPSRGTRSRQPASPSSGAISPTCRWSASWSRRRTPS